MRSRRDSRNTSLGGGRDPAPEATAQTILALLVAYARRGSRAEAQVAADALREAGYTEAADDVDFSARHCGAGKRELAARIGAELRGTVLRRGTFPALSRHAYPGYAPPWREWVAILGGGGVEVWVRDGWEARRTSRSKRYSFDCAWSLWRAYPRTDPKFMDEQHLLDHVDMELSLAEHLHPWTEKWLRSTYFVPNEKLLHWGRLLRETVWRFRQPVGAADQTYQETVHGWRRQLHAEIDRRGLR